MDFLNRILDILFYDNLIFNSEYLTIPHQELHKRHFVLRPLLEIAPNFVHPVFEVNIKTLYEKIVGKENQDEVKNSIGEGAKWG